jgi:hypothetical protein
MKKHGGRKIQPLRTLHLSLEEVQRYSGGCTRAGCLSMTTGMPIWLAALFVRNPLALRLLWAKSFHPERFRKVLDILIN